MLDGSSLADSARSTPIPQKTRYQKQDNNGDQLVNSEVPEKHSSLGSSIGFQSILTNTTNTIDPNGTVKTQPRISERKYTGDNHVPLPESKGTHLENPSPKPTQSSEAHHSSAELSRPKPYRSEVFGFSASIAKNIRTLFHHLTYELSPMDKQGPMNGRCVNETDQMVDFLKRNFNFQNIENQFIVPSVKAFKLGKPPSHMRPDQKIYFPAERHDAFVMTVSEILRWQNSFAVYVDRQHAKIDKHFLRRALQGGSARGDEAFQIKFVVRISDCPIVMTFDTKILCRSLNDDWPNRIKLVSMTGIDFAGRIHDVYDITTYIKNWRNVFHYDQKRDVMAVFNGRDFRPVKCPPPVVLDKNLLLDHLKYMAKLRLRACDEEKVEIVVETGIGLGMFSGKHIGIDHEVRRLSARAIRSVIEEQGTKYKNIRAIIFSLPIFSEIRSGSPTSDVYHDFVKEFRESNYSGSLPVLIVDQDMHVLTVHIARQGFRVSQLNPADSHSVFGEYWQNYGPAVEEKLALTTLGLLIQHHLINPSILDDNRYHFV